MRCATQTTRRLRLRPFRPLAAALAIVFLAGPAAGAPVRTAFEDQPLVVFFSLPWDPLSGHVSGELVQFTAPDRRGYSEILVRDEAGDEHSIAWRGARRRPYLRPQETYDIVVEHRAGPEAASAVVIHDSGGLLYAAATDRAPGATILKKGLPGFEFHRTEDALGNPAGLEVVHRGRKTTLRPGWTVRIGVYDVACSIVRGTDRVTWTVARHDPVDEENFAFAPGR